MSPYNMLNVVEEIGGQGAIKVVQMLDANEKITETQIAESTGLKLSQVRKILYKLNETQIATYHRERDPETGWYIYHWFLHRKGLVNTIHRRQELVLNVLMQRFDFESQGPFYTCENKCHKFDFKEAFEAQFMCPNCGLLLLQIDNKKILRLLERKISQLSKTIKDFERLES